MTALVWAAAALGVFASAVAYDYAFSRYVATAAARRAVAAASWSAATYVIGLVGIASVLGGSLWLAIPEAAGLFVGTLLGIRATERRSLDRDTSTVRRPGGRRLGDLGDENRR